MPTLPALTSRVAPIARSNCTWVWPFTTVCWATPARIGARRSSLESGVTISSSLRGVAWQKSTSPRPSISTDGERREAAHPVEARLIEHAGRPVRARRPDVVRVDARGSGVEPQPGLDELALAVAADRDRAVAERPHRIGRLAGERPAGDVAADHDQIDADRVDLGQDGRERGVVAVDVVERRDPHGPQGTACSRVSPSMSSAASSSASATPAAPA